MQSIVYPIGEALYLNITNRCTNQCPFCIRNKAKVFNKKHSLWLEREPSTEEILQAIGDPSQYKQIVFCGYGEPLIRLGVVKEVAEVMRDANRVTRIDTNGQANLLWGRDILPELKNLIDYISISLDAENAEVYEQICCPTYGQKAYPAIIEFIKEAKKHIPTVEASVVDLPMINIQTCQKIAGDLGVKFRVRPYYEEKYIK